MATAETHSNTEQKPRRNTSGLIPFTKNDPRENRKGRPKSFDAFREIALCIANETVASATKKMGASDVKPEIAKLRVAEYILRKWAFSGDGKLQKAFTEVAYGKVPDELEVTGTIRYEEVKQSLAAKLSRLSEVFIRTSLASLKIV